MNSGFRPGTTTRTPFRSDSAAAGSPVASRTTHIRIRSHEEATVSLQSVEHRLAQDGECSAWEVFHENSKLSRHEPHATFARHPSDATVVRVMRRLGRHKPYDDCPKVPLPVELPASSIPFDEVLARRESPRAFETGPIALAQLARICSPRPR